MGRLSQVLAIALCVMFAVAQAPAQSRLTKTVSGGQLTFTFDTAFIQTARTVGINPTRTRPGRVKGGTVTLPISVGSIDTATGQIELVEPGGFTFTSGTNRLQLVNLIITVDSGQQAVLSAIAVVNGRNVGRVPIFNLQLPGLTLPLKPDANGNITIQGIQFTLSDQLANSLNTSFATSSFTSGMLVGTATIVVRLGVPGEGF